MDESRTTTTPIAGAMPYLFADRELWLLPDRAVWWRAQRALVIADPHFGKAASFRQTGVPVPVGTTAKNLSRIGCLLEQTGADRLIVLGDFLHSRAGRQPEVIDAIADWRHRHAALSIVLIRGNHDRSAGETPAEWHFEQAERTLVEDGICLAHDPATTSPLPMLAGHVHPVFTLQDFDRSAVTAPCFVFDPRVGTLPAFGSFTGGWRIAPQPGRRIFLVAGSRVVAMPNPPGQG